MTQLIILSIIITIVAVILLSVIRSRTEEHQSTTKARAYDEQAEKRKTITNDLRAIHRTMTKKAK